MIATNVIGMISETLGRAVVSWEACRHSSKKIPKFFGHILEDSEQMKSPLDDF